MKPIVKVVAVVLAVLAVQIVLVVVWIVLYWKNPLLASASNFIAWVQTWTLVATAVVVGIYTYQTHRIRKTADEQMRELRSTNEFDAYTRIHAQLSNERSCLSRRHLFHSKFKGAFAKATNDALGAKLCAAEKEVDIELIMKNMSKDDEKLAVFKDSLFTIVQHRDRTTVRIDFCDALEMVLLDLDIIAGPLYRQNRAVEEAVKIYEPIIRVTAPALRPFVAVQMMLKGDNDYRKHYRYLLQYFDLDLLGGLPEVKPPGKRDILEHE